MIRDLGWLLGPGRVPVEPQPLRRVRDLRSQLRLGGLDVFGYHVDQPGHPPAGFPARVPAGPARLPDAARPGSRLAPATLAAVAFVGRGPFVAHPLGTQAVTYIVQRLTSLAALFYLAAVTLYLSWRLPRSHPRPRAGVAPPSTAGCSSRPARRADEGIAFTLPGRARARRAPLLPAERAPALAPVVPGGGDRAPHPGELDRVPGARSRDAAASADRVTRLLTPMSRLDYAEDPGRRGLRVPPAARLALRAEPRLRLPDPSTRPADRGCSSRRRFSPRSLAFGTLGCSPAGPPPRAPVAAIPPSASWPSASAGSSSRWRSSRA